MRVIESATQTLRKDEAPGVMAEGFEGTEKANSTYSAARTAIEASDKDFAGMRARLAIAGWTLQVIDDGHGAAYVVGRWGQSRWLPDRHAVRSFMRVIGVPA